MKILYDCSGGDKAPDSIVKGAYLAKEKYGLEPYFVGKIDQLKNLVEEADHKNIIEAEEKIENDEDPAMAIRKKRKSSIVVAMNNLAAGSFDGLISAGSTGALLAGGLFILKRIKGIQRAALPVIIPGLRGQTMIMDVGANMDTSPELLFSFARMGSVYLENVLDIKNPKIGLLNVGVEKGKGDKRAIETYQLLEESSLNFFGNIEARDLFSSEVDLIVTDGFAGNILLKTTEGAVEFILGSLKENLSKANTDEATIKSVSKLIKLSLEKMDYKKYGGVPLLGLKSPVVKAHGSSDEEAILNASHVLINMIDNRVIDKI